MSIEVTEAKRKEDYAYWVQEGLDRGYKPGWAAWKYKDEYGAWPPKEWAPKDDIGLSEGQRGTAIKNPDVPKHKKCPTCGAWTDPSPPKATYDAQGEINF